jgi:hypothetical protein
VDEKLALRTYLPAYDRFCMLQAINEMKRIKTFISNQYGGIKNNDIQYSIRIAK